MMKQEAGKPKKRERRSKKRLRHEMRVAGVRHFEYTATLRNTARYAPNEPCPCGSDKKYKRCCMTVVRQAKTTAIEHLRCGWCSSRFREGDKIKGFRLGKAYCSQPCLIAARKKGAQ